MDEQRTIELYAHYADWKGWKGNPNVRAAAERYRREATRAGVAPHSRILELGFGDGVFLDWAAASGYDVYGAEITEDFVATASARGHRVVLGSVQDAADRFGPEYDAVFAFDVLEHIDTSELGDVLAQVSRVLRKRGKLVACFPNGASPFGRFYQHSDLTHRSVLTGRSLGQLGLIVGLKVVSVHNAARSLFGSRPYLAPINVVASVARLGIGACLSYLFFGCYVPMDPVTTVVLEKC